MDNFSYIDLASEFIKAKGKPFEGVCKVSEIVLDATLAEKYGKAEGKYVTLETDVLTEYDEKDHFRLATALSHRLSALIADKRKILVVGLGNGNMTADSLGAETCKLIEVGENVKTVCPDVECNTGVDSFDVISGVVSRINPTAVVAIDSLSAASTVRLCRVIQMCDAGITPGSGVSNHRRKLSFYSLGVPVVSIGVPLVVYASTIIRDAGGDDDGYESMIVTPKDIDYLVRSSASVIARAINAL
ncbi:MAG: GPR endopeptidase [Clostridia bacterium]|nr:GPR endopeptidase [Clostridia bacterium]